MISKSVNKIYRLQQRTLIPFFSSLLKSKDHLKASDMLINRHIGPNQEETKEMLKVCHVNTIEELVRQAIPSNIRDQNSLNEGLIGAALSQSQFLIELKKCFSKNKNYKCYLGGGFHPTILPGVIQRNLFENPGWYTAYTPYQAQIAQGRLQSLINYQTMVQQLTKLDFSNASLLDEASAGGQGFYMTFNVHEGKRRKFFMDRNVFIPTQSVIKTKAKFLDIQIIVADYKDFLTPKYNKQQFCGILVQTPDNRGVLHDFTNFFKQIDNTKSDVIKIVGSDLLALAITKAPGDMGADICFGSSQRFGVPMGFGGPYSGYFATKNRFVRKMPGRIIGISKDAHGQSAYRMALQTRQQHIRRQKATSNICTAQALLANISAMYAIYHGTKGIRNISERVNNYAQIGARIFQSYGFKTTSSNSQYSLIFDTFTVLNCQAKKITQTFQKHRVNVRLLNDSQISLSFSEVNTVQDLEQINSILAEFTKKQKKNIDELDFSRKPFSPQLHRNQDYMKQQIFNSIHSQHQMLRYLNHLQQKDVSLNKSMIPLGSCTMKLNASSQMVPLSWPQLNLHPFVPIKQAQGYIQMIQRLRDWLKQITKFDEISFQPNSGATGEYAGLLTINQYLRAKGQSNRKLCLIPKSAHGTNPASAYLAGMQVIPIQVQNGKVDMKDFKIKAQKYKNDIGAFMITFPSTAGRYQSTIHEMTEIIHHYGGQVYMDGANMNAQVGYTSPRFLGADVCHLNLHKTFSIPHGGGGPGMGPIGVKKHLAPYLPTHPFSLNYNQNSFGTIAASQFGSASILTISYGYIAMLGREGIKKSTAYAILNANYLMTRLRPYYKILYIESNERCGHEFIIDVTPIKNKTGVSQQDIAKRLMDFGFHAPTMSFPVAGTLMVEPTESQDKGQLDRFADALIKIFHESHNCPQIVKNAPYTASDLVRSNWEHKFSRQQAAYPLNWVKKRGKFWPSVGRISNPYGDKNLVCSCPDISSYLE